MELLEDCDVALKHEWVLKQMSARVIKHENGPFLHPENLLINRANTLLVSHVWNRLERLVLESSVSVRTAEIQKIIEIVLVIKKLDSW